MQQSLLHNVSYLKKFFQWEKISKNQEKEIEIKNWGKTSLCQIFIYSEI